MRWAVIKNNRVQTVSSERLHGNNLVVEVPEELSHIPSSDLILNGRFKNGQISCKLLKNQLTSQKLL